MEESEVRALAKEEIEFHIDTHHEPFANDWEGPIIHDDQGEPRLTTDGLPLRDYEDGARYQIAQLYDGSVNGGLRSRLGKLDRGAIFGGLGFAAAAFAKSAGWL